MEERKEPHSTLDRISRHILPDVAHRFLFGPMSDFRIARYLIGGALGAIIGTILIYGTMISIPLTTFHRIIIGCVIVALFALSGMLSPNFRCSLLLVLPTVLGSKGFTSLTLFIIHCLYQGPISNIQHNVQEVVSSLGCNIDLQIGHTKIMWRTVSEPMFQVLQEIVADSEQLQRETVNVSRQFQSIRDEVMGQYGYDSLDQNLTATGNNTQEQYTAKTILRCEYVVKQGINHCTEWFSDTWRKCMNTIKSPVINHFLCVPMKFDFLCNIMRVMTPWCKEQIPVEGNFGQTFDRLNSAMSKLGEQFTTNVVLNKIEDQPMFAISVFQEEFRTELKTSFKEMKDTIDQISMIIQILLSFTVIDVFISACGYLRHYNRDIYFDNVYITTYFKQIDLRRQALLKRFLLPLHKAEMDHFIEPCNLKISFKEMKPVVPKLFQVVLLSIFVCVLLVTDKIFYDIFHIFSKHTFIEHSFQSHHDIHIDISGESMLANLLRKTIGAFNTSSNLYIESSNLKCIPQPRTMSQADYLWSTLPLLGMVFLCCLQVYTNRLRRVITTFYFPKREKKRIIFLYNLQLQRRINFFKRISKQFQRQQKAPKTVLSVMLSALNRFGCGVCSCWVCEKHMWQRRAVHCSAVDCNALYCAQCWKDLGNRCTCSFSNDQEPQDRDSDIETVYYVK